MGRLGVCFAALLALSAGTGAVDAQSVWPSNGQTFNIELDAHSVVRDERGQHYLVDRRSGQVIARLNAGDPRIQGRSSNIDMEFDRYPRWGRDRYEQDFDPGWRRQQERWQRRMERAERRRLRAERRSRARAWRQEQRRLEVLRRQDEWRDHYASRDSRWFDSPSYNQGAFDRDRDAPVWERDVDRDRIYDDANPHRPKARTLKRRDRFESYEQMRVERSPLPPIADEPNDLKSAPNNEQQIARLPDLEAPIQRPSTIPSLTRPGYDETRMLELQIVLDRAGFSPGVIDGRWGANVEKALLAYKKAHGGKLNLLKPADLAKALKQSGGAALVQVRLTSEDVKGPFVGRIPIDYARKAKMKAMSFTSLAEKLAEKFHISEAMLASLNGGKSSFRAGETITVPALGSSVKRPVHYLVADKDRAQVFAYDRHGKLVAAYPATIGSSSTPSPSGKHAVKTIAFNPQYTYDPVKNFKQGNNDKVLRIPPGPNGPVGSVWIGLSKDTYGIHGTPRPESIGKTNSNGCIRLTNWDANELAKLVRKGVTVEFRGG